MWISLNKTPGADGPKQSPLSFTVKGACQAEAASPEGAPLKATKAKGRKVQ